MKKVVSILTALMVVGMLSGCNQTQDESSQSSTSESTSQSSVSEPESSDQSSEASQPVDEYLETGEHTVELCNGTGQDIASLRIRPEGGEDDYWSLEILGGADWKDGTVISLTLKHEEWGDCTSWQAEATLADGTVENYSELPLTGSDRVELAMGSFRAADAE